MRRVLLLTDGLANHGETAPDALAAKAAELRGQGITTSTFGVGADFDERLLARLAAEGGGHFYFIEHPQQIPDLLASELGETLEVVARDVVFEIAAGPGVDLGLLNDRSTASAPGVLRVPLGDLVANQEVALVVAVGVRQAPAAGDAVSVQCRVADREQRLPALPMEVAWTAADAAADQAQPVNADVLVEVARLLAEQARTMALTANRRGAYDEARRILADMAQTLHALLPGDARVAAIAARLHDEMGEYSLALDAVEVKRRHFASRMVAESRAVEGKARRGGVARRL